jgi:glycosyltransferase involved in cell wall biosynthesis
MNKKKLKIIFLSNWFSNKMGYIENCLPKALAELGHEVHIISSTAQVYYNSPEYKEVYEPFLGKNILPEGTIMEQGCYLHRIPFGELNGKIYFKKLNEKLKEINPDVVQVFDAFSFTTLQAAYYKLKFGYKLFTANHTVASVFALYQPGNQGLLKKIIFYFTLTLPGKFISLVTSRCFPATIDALDLAVKYYGVQKSKVKLASLGVDTDFFKPPDSNNINNLKQLREKLGFKENEILCIYTGRFTEGKNPLLLAKAIEKLNKENEPFKALFMGDGPQAEEIKKHLGCKVHEFVPYHELPTYYQLSDIGVWPKQESTSMIDASACGLPIVISNKVQAKERVEGNGLTYIENDFNSLADELLKLKDVSLRKELGSFGKNKVQTKYSWNKIAKEREQDYYEFV